MAITFGAARGEAYRRVNLVNLREYFSAIPSAVRDALIEHQVELVEYQEASPVEEFCTSHELRKAIQLTSASRGT